MSYRRIPDECPICLVTFEARCWGWCAKKTTKVSCGHRFHKSCIDNWTTIHHRCPMCSAHIGKSEFGPEHFVDARSISLTVNETDHICIFIGLTETHSFNRKAKGVWEELMWGELLSVTPTGIAWGNNHITVKSKTFERLRDIIRN